MKTLTLYIPFPHYASIGGPSTFMGNLQRCLDSVRYPYSTSAEDAQAIFFPISHDIEAIKKIKGRGGTVIQRLDGIYYPSKHNERYVELNREIEDIYLNYADFVIFQSEYSRKQCFAMLGEKRSDDYEIILNGVDKSIFYPSRERKKGDRLRLVTTGNFRNVDMIEPVVKALDSLKGRFPFELIVAGPVVNGELEIFLERDYVTKAGAKELTEVAHLLRGCDIFLYSHLNPPCPNSVIEAISCGLPVVGFDSGAMSELLYFGRDLLAPVSNDVFQSYADFNPKRLADKISLCADKYEFYRERALEYSNLYSFDDCGKKYVKIFERFIG
jgi:glycosyltransferase involved in cell wall biosynthesis